MKKIIFLIFVLSILGTGCGDGKDASSQVENIVENGYETEQQISDIYISHTTKCSREEEPQLYEAMQKLLTDRAEIQFMLASPDIDLNSKETIETADGMLYYPLKDETLSKEKLRNQLLEVYETNYVDRVLLPYYFDTAKCYMEQDGRLYGQDVAAVITTLKEDWKLWQVNENYYYLQGYEDTDVKEMVILTIVRSEDGAAFGICDELEINFAN